MDTECSVVCQWSPTPVGLPRFVCSLNLWLNGLLLSPMCVWLLSLSHLTGVLSVFCHQYVTKTYSRWVETLYVSKGVKSVNFLQYNPIFERYIRNSYLLVDEDLIGQVNQLVNVKHLLPVCTAEVMLHHQDENHHCLHHQLTVLRLGDTVQYHLHLQAKLQLSLRHLTAPPQTCSLIN